MPKTDEEIAAEEKAAQEAEEAAAKKKAEEEKGEKKPPWESEENFDPERAWKLIQSVRDEASKAKSERDELRGKVQKHEDASKSDQEKLEERATGAEQRAVKAEAETARLRVALDKGLTLTQAKRLVGESEEDLAKDADELLASFKSEEDEDTRRAPRERMRTGSGAPAEKDENDPAKLAAAVPRSTF